MSVRRLRLASGCLLFAYVATHLLNHAAGLVSVAAAEAVRSGFLALWRSPPGTVLLYGALLLHMLLAFSALLRRRTLRMPWLDAVRILLGLAIPLLLASHIAATRLAHSLYGLDDTYTHIVGRIWASDGGARQLALMATVWCHGCLGIHFAARHRSGYQRQFHLAFAGALLLPVLAGLGFLAMGRELAPAGDPGSPLGEAQAGVLSLAASSLVAGFAALLGLGIAARLWRDARARRSGHLITRTYPGQSVQVPRRWSVLAARRAHGIPHLSLCGGLGRCSTCRVRVSHGLEGCAPPDADERRTLARIGAAGDVRLACQLRPTADLAVTPLLAPGPSSPYPEGAMQAEREAVILFVDLRRWTTLSERHLPHDLAYVLERFFAIVGESVRREGGVPNQFIGDSVMAIFGLQSDLPAACRAALRAAQALEAGLEAANGELQRDFGQRLDFGMGLHAGRVALGEVGWRDTRTFTAVGDAVNTAARLQELCKEFGVRLVASDTVLHAAGAQAHQAAAHVLPLRGRGATLAVQAIRSASDLVLG